MPRTLSSRFMKKYYQEERATQAALFLLKKHSGKMPYIKLMKLLFIADRQILLETGESLSNDAYVSMHCGPVLSITLDIIRNTNFVAEFGDYWRQFITTTDLDVVLIQESDFMELTEKEEEILERVFEQRGHDDKWDLVEWTHRHIPEWEEVSKGESKPIRFETVFEKASRNPEEAKEYLERLKYFASLDNLVHA